MLFSSEMSNSSKEVLFEVWNDAKSESFMGLGIVSVDELLITQNQRLVIPLQGNPSGLGKLSDQAKFGGMLTVQFLLTEDKSKPKMAPISYGSGADNQEINNGHQNGLGEVMTYVI